MNFTACSVCQKLGLYSQQLPTTAHQCHISSEVDLTVRGPWREKIDNKGEFTVKVRTEPHGGGDISSRVTFQEAKVREPLLAVSGVID